MKAEQSTILDAIKTLENCRDVYIENQDQEKIDWANDKIKKLKGQVIIDVV